MYLKPKFPLFNFYSSLVLILICLLNVQILFANQMELWQKGVHALEQKDYQKAMQVFQSIEKNNEGGAGLYQNMALAATSLGDDAKAILYLEKALKYAPNDSKIKDNLHLVLQRNSQLDNIDAQNGLNRSLQTVSGWLSLEIWMTLSILLFLSIGFYSYSLYPFQPIAKGKKIILSILIIASLACYLCASVRFQTIYHNKGIIITEENTQMHVGPDADSPSVTDLPKGSKVVFKDHIADWWLVTTVYGDEGWIPANKGERI